MPLNCKIKELRAEDDWQKLRLYPWGNMFEAKAWKKFEVKKIQVKIEDFFNSNLIYLRPIKNLH